MNITQTKTGTNTLKLTVEINKNDYANSVDTSLLDYRKKMTLPGFRAGRVPMGIVKKKYELSIRVEEINKLLSNFSTY